MQRTLRFIRLLVDVFFSLFYVFSSVLACSVLCCVCFLWWVTKHTLSHAVPKDSPANMCKRSIFKLNLFFTCLFWTNLHCFIHVHVHTTRTFRNYYSSFCFDKGLLQIDISFLTGYRCKEFESIVIFLKWFVAFCQASYNLIKHRARRISHTIRKRNQRFVKMQVSN